MIHKAFSLLTAALFATSCVGASAQANSPTAMPMTPFEKQIHRMDFAITGIGEYNNTVSGPILKPAAPDCNPAPGTSAPCLFNLTQYGSNTFGALATIRYVAKPYVGFEFNYGYARYTENYSYSQLPQIQTKATEYTLGYVATPKHTIFGFQPFLGAGVGTIAFRPTPHGGQGEPVQARMAYYYGLGVQQEYLSGHFGLRAGFRQLFFLDPDFESNYLTIKKTASTYEPQAGFYLRY